MKKKFWLSTTLILIVLVQAACTFSVATIPAETPTSAAPEPTAVTNPEESPTTVESCPAETAEAKLLRSDENGYCFLYPAAFTEMPPRFVVINPTNAPGDQPGDAWLDIMVEPANGRTVDQVVDDAVTGAGPGFNIQQEQLVVDDVRAIVVDGLPGPDSLRRVFVVSNDRLYSFSFMPWGQNADLQSLYDWTIKTLHFLP